jgi:DNA-binding HxlR family transcriptional regulator
MITEGRKPDDAGNEELVHEVTQRTRGRIIQDILGHPYKSPSFDEIDFMNPGLSSATLREHLNKLIEYGLVRKVEAPEDERTRDFPFVFYTLSDTGRDFLETHNLYVDEEEEIEREYAEVDKPEHILNKQNDAPRPTALFD